MLSRSEQWNAETARLVAASGQFEPLAAGAAPCAVREILNRVGHDWVALVLFLLAARPLRFNAMSRIIPGISNKVLAQTLRNLERDGLIERVVLGTRPPGTEYRLLPLGVSFINPLAAVVSWAERNYPLIVKARSVYDETIGR